MGSFSVLNNIAGLNAQNQLNLNNVNLSRTLQRISSGQRINSGADDPAGLQMADSLQANVMALDQGVRNANDGISVAQIADGALQEISNLLTSGVTLAEEASTGTVDSTGRASLNSEFAQIQSEIARIASQTNYNGMGVFTTSGVNGSLSVFVGDVGKGSSSIAVTISTITVSGNTVTHLGTQAGVSTVDLTQQSTAATSLQTVKSALSTVGNMRADIGAGINRLQAAINVMQTQSQNTQSAESSIRDANMAQEVANLTRYQILAQSGIASLAQANTNSQQVLTLLRNL